MVFGTVDDIETALRSGEVSVRTLHGVCAQRRPILDAAQPKSGRNGIAEAPQIDWLRGDISLPYHFTKRKVFVHAQTAMNDRLCPFFVRKILQGYPSNHAMVELEIHLRSVRAGR